MNTHPFRPFFLPVLLASLGLTMTDRVTAQTLTILHVFTASPNTNSSGSVTNSDGANPDGALVLSGNALYGTASQGGSGGNGTVFKVNTDGTSFTNLYTFTPSPPPGYGNSDGANPEAGLVLSGNTLYGAADTRGVHQSGTLFALNTNGTSFTNLYSFTATSGSPNYANSDGEDPDAGLLLSGNTLYGTTYNGGVFGGGAVFKVNTNGTSFLNLHSFAAISYYPNNTNSDGGNPSSVLVLSGNTLYGTTDSGGTNGNGTVFRVNTDSTGFTNLHIFTANSNSPYSNSDGALPEAGLILSGDTLYGTAVRGGSGNNGTVFSINTNGTGFTTLHSFAAGGYDSISGSETNSDGANPYAGLLLSGNTLFGTTGAGGSSGSGAVFEINTNGTGFTTLYYFTPLSAPYYNAGTNADGALPRGSLILSGNTLYGTTVYGGSSGNGTVFALSVPLPSLEITSAGSQIVLSWPTNATGFALQSTTNLTSGSWSNVTSGIATIGSNYVYTNTPSGTSGFFRLKQ